MNKLASQRSRAITELLAAGLTRRAIVAAVGIHHTRVGQLAKALPTSEGEQGRRVKVREVISLLEADGWHLLRTRGDHRQYGHPAKPGLVTVSGNLGRDVPPGTLASILRQAGLKRSGA